MSRKEILLPVTDLKEKDSLYDKMMLYKICKEFHRLLGDGSCQPSSREGGYRV